MRLKRSNQKGVRAEVMQKVRLLERRCDALEQEMAKYAFAERLGETIRRVAALEDR